MRMRSPSIRLGLLALSAGLMMSGSGGAAELELIRGAETPIVLKQEDLARLGPEQIQFGAHDASPSSYTCASLNRLLQSAGVPSGEALRGAELRKIALVEASDGYAVAFSLGEL